MGNSAGKGQTSIWSKVDKFRFSTGSSSPYHELGKQLHYLWLLHSIFRLLTMIVGHTWGQCQGWSVFQLLAPL